MWRTRIPLDETKAERLTGAGLPSTICAGLFMKNVLFVLLLALVSVRPMAADDEGQHHHEALTEQQLGTVHFPVSCTAAVQKPFARGVALLHSFWYEEAQKEFEQIAKDVLANPVIEEYRVEFVD